MKKIFALFITLFSVICFNSCEDIEDLKEFKYRLQAGDSTCNGIIIHEIDKSGAIVKKHSIYELSKNIASDEYLITDNVKKIKIYYKTTILGTVLYSEKTETTSYFREYKGGIFDFNTIILNSNGKITEEEYNFYVNQ